MWDMTPSHATGLLELERSKTLSYCHKLCELFI